MLIFKLFQLPIMARMIANSVDPDEMLHFVATHLVNAICYCPIYRLLNG